MARVPKTEGHRGGITAFVVEGDSPGRHRRAAQRVPGPARPGEQRHPLPRRPRARPTNVIGGEGQGLKIALTTLNTGRLSLPAMCVGAGKWCLNVAREWAAERGAVGPPGRRARGGRQEDRVHRRPRRTAWRPCSTCPACSPTTTATTSASRPRWSSCTRSEMAWQVADELVQIRGGRGYETADSLAARGERADPGRADPARPADQPHLRGLDRDHAPAHRPRGGRRAPLGGRRHHRPRGRRSARKAQGRPRKAGGFYATWLPTLAVGTGQLPTAYARVRPARQAPALRRARLPQAGPVDLLRRWPAGRASWSASRASSAAIVDIGAELFAMSAACVRARTEQDDRPEGVELADLFCRQARLRAEALFHALWDNTDAVDVRRPRSGSSPGATCPGGGHHPARGHGAWVAPGSRASRPPSRRPPPL